MTTFKRHVDGIGHIRWTNDKDQLHREDGPAIEWADGVKHWWINGERHRLDGPAAEWPRGHKEWYVAGKYCLECNFPVAVIIFLLNVDITTAKLIENFFNDTI